MVERRPLRTRAIRLGLVKQGPFMNRPQRLVKDDSIPPNKFGRGGWKVLPYEG